MTDLTLQGSVDVNDMNLASLTVNLRTVREWADRYFIDIAKQTRPWQSQSSGALDFEGNLTGMSGAGQQADIVLSASPLNVARLLREYTVTWDDGAGTVVTDLYGGLTIISSGTNTASFTVDNMDNARGLRFAGFDGSSPPVNVKIIAVADQVAYDAGERFDSEFLATYDNTFVNVLRFMDWTQANNSGVANFSDNPSVGAQTYQYRVPLEVQIMLCNKLGVDGWFFVPHQATDAYILEMAQIINATLDAGLKARIEYSNEVWNNTFSQKAYAIAQGVTLGFGSDGYSSFAGYSAVRIKTILDTVSTTRFETVLGIWAASTSQQTKVMDAPEWFADDPGSHVSPWTIAKYIASADYLGEPNEAAESIAATWNDDVVSGDYTATDAALTAYLSGTDNGGMQWVKDKMSDCYTNMVGVDTTDGVTPRDIRMCMYEGGSSHIVFNSAYTAQWSRPSEWSVGRVVLDGASVRNAAGRIYTCATGGTCGATEPTHTDGSTVTDGTVLWEDAMYAGLNSLVWWYEYRMESSKGILMDQDYANIIPWVSGATYTTDWAALTAVTEGEYKKTAAGAFVHIKTTGTTGANTLPTNKYNFTFEGIDYISMSCSMGPASDFSFGRPIITSTGKIYWCMDTGVTGTVEPTHATGSATVDGTTYIAADIYRSLGAWLPESEAYFERFLFDDDYADLHLELYQHLKDIGGEGPVVYTDQGSMALAGPWGKLRDWTDADVSSTRKLYHRIKTWCSTTGSRWWL